MGRPQKWSTLWPSGWIYIRIRYFNCDILTLSWHWWPFEIDPACVYRPNKITKKLFWFFWSNDRSCSKLPTFTIDLYFGKQINVLLKTTRNDKKKMFFFLVFIYSDIIQVTEMFEIGHGRVQQDNMAKVFLVVHA